jgi:plastocyanin
MIMYPGRHRGYLRRATDHLAGRVTECTLAVTLTVTLVFAGGLGLAGCGYGNAAANSPGVTASLAPVIDHGVQVFDVVGLRTLQFSAAELIAKPGRIRVNFSVEKQSAPHNFVIPDIPDGHTSILPAGASESITFTAGERGTYPVICTLHPNMLATLKIV